MRKSLAVVAVALSVAGCSQFNIGRSSIDPQFPQVSIVRDRYIVIDQEPIIAQRGSTITWQLPEGKAAFDEKGITIDALVKEPPRAAARPHGEPSKMSAQSRASSAAGLFPCNRRSDREFSCVVPRDARAGQYAYTVRVKAPSGFLILDPTVIVEE